MATELSDIVTQVKDGIISKGIEECGSLLPKQESNMRDFYRGSIAGFKECRYLNTPDEYKNVLEELNQEEIREISKASLRDKELRESLGLTPSETETNKERVWYLKGMRTQTEFVYQRIKLLLDGLG